jgi:hypothetical protein
MIDWARIEGFIGFGRRNAPVVFIGMEEGLTESSALDDDLKLRSTYEDSVMDLKTAHRGVAESDRIFDPDLAYRQPTWRVMADIMLRRAGNPDPTRDDRRRYGALQLGRSAGDSLLAELLPYPHTKSSEWLYERFGRHLTREDYTSKLLPDRKRLLRSVLAEAQRELIVCYGKAHWRSYQEIFEQADWSWESPFIVAEWRGARVVLTKHFSSSAFNTDKQLAQLASIALLDRPTGILS